jgi:hypothetical protein
MNARTVSGVSAAETAETANKTNNTQRQHRQVDSPMSREHPTAPDE